MRARPVTTVLPHSPIVSINDPLSKNPDIHFPPTLAPEMHKINASTCVHFYI